MTGFPLELTRPWALVALAVLPVLVYYFIWSLSDFPRRQRLISLAIRSVIVLLVVLSLAGLTLLRDVRDQFVIFLVDDSLSVDKEGAAKVETFLEEAEKTKGANRLAFLKFAKSPGEVREERTPKAPPTDAPPAEPLPQPSADDPRQGTNIAAAIESAAGFLPPGYVPQLVVLSDGNQTSGDALQAALRSGVPVSTIPLPTRTDPEVQVSEVGVPAEVREGEPFNVEVVVHSNHDDEGLIEVYRGDHKVIGEKKPIKKGENRFKFQQSVERERLAAYTARVSDLKEDTLLDNNSETGLVFTSGKPRVLIIESDPNLIRELAFALEDEGIQADIRPPQGMPDSLADLQNYELLAISNVPATALSQKQMDVARTFVQELGGGFMMLGGEQSFGLGGYYKSTLEEILPVRSDFEKEKEKPSLGMVLIIDKSGSMSGEPVEIAKSAARSAVELLGKRDQCAVLAFDGDTYVISEMQSASNKGKISDEIGQIEASGGTTMYPAMEQAFEILQTTPAKLKHVIVLTDGVSSPGDFAGMAQQMAAAKITVSTVAMGGADTTLLEEIAREGKGRYYHAEDISTIPQIFAKETVTASKSAIDEQPFVPQIIRKSHALSGIDLDSAPFLLGYVITRPKPTSEVILATEKGDPLLSWWRYGLGMTVAFTSDAKSRWAAEWLTWPGFGKFWTQVVRQAMRKGDARGVQVALNRKDQGTEVTVDAVDQVGRFLNDADVEMTVIDPQLKRTPLKLSQTAPGRFVQNLETSLSGAYHLEINVKQKGQSLYRQSRGLTVGYSDELRIKPTNEAFLQELATVSGGRFTPVVKDLFESDRTASRPTPLWPLLLTLGALLFVLDVALRRIDFSLHWPFRSRSVLKRSNRVSLGRNAA
ncbi:MAG TPA: VWA domain-containing protein [Caulifigura sp.]|nr:VWA domain-containing protein [Caulifigura sp.]